MPQSLLPRALAPFIAAFTLAACTPQASDDAVLNDAPSTSADASPAAAALAADTMPHAERGTMEECPYLDTHFVADTNGQRMTDFGVDHRFDPPACIFWSYPVEPQVTVLVREMDSFEQAMEVVDFAAPIDTTSPAEFDGWQGGRGPSANGGSANGGPTPGGSVYAIAKDTTAVVVWSNQEQSVKAETIAQQVISNLRL